MFQAIEVIYLGPTNNLGSRWKARTVSGADSVTLPQNCALNPDENALRAARALAEKLDWAGTYYGGFTRHGYMFVSVVHERKPAFVLGAKPRPSYVEGGTP